MSISLLCPACEKPLKTQEKFAGKRVKCPACGQLISVPAAPLAGATSASPGKARAANKSERVTDLPQKNDQLPVGPSRSLVIFLFMLVGIQILLTFTNPVTQSLSVRGTTRTDDRTFYLTHWGAVGVWIPVAIIPLVILVRVLSRIRSRGKGYDQTSRVVRYSDFLLKFDLFAIFFWFEVIALLLMADGSAMDVRKSGDGMAITATRAFGDMTFWIPQGFPAIAIVMLLASAAAGRVDVLVLQRKRVGIRLVLIAALLVVASETRAFFVLGGIGNLFNFNNWLLEEIIFPIYGIATVIYLVAYVIAIWTIRRARTARQEKGTA